MIMKYVYILYYNYICVYNFIRIQTLIVFFAFNNKNVFEAK